MANNRNDTNRSKCYLNQLQLFKLSLQNLYIWIPWLERKFFTGRKKFVIFYIFLFLYYPLLNVSPHAKNSVKTRHESL